MESGATPTNGIQLTTVETVETTETVTDENKVFQSLNLNLQVKVYNLENEIKRLKAQLDNQNRNGFVYESLSKDLAQLRHQCDKLSVALVRKCEENQALKKEIFYLRAKQSQSPVGKATPVSRFIPSPLPYTGNLKRKLYNFEDNDVVGDLKTHQLDRKSKGRPSMGSCGNLPKQIADEEAFPTRTSTCGDRPPSLRNRVLMRLHSFKAASTESLESSGRKSLRVEEKKESQTLTKSSRPERPTAANKATSNSSVDVKPRLKSAPGKVTRNPSIERKPSSSTLHKKCTVTPTLSSTLKNTSGSEKFNNVPPSYRPALSSKNGQQKLVRAVPTSIKRSDSGCSAKSTSSTGSRPGFRV